MPDNRAEHPHADARLLTGGAPLARARAAAVLLHGRGAAAEGMLHFGDELAQPEVALVAPQAQGFVWYPHSFLAPLEANEPWLSSALAAVDRALDEVRSGGVPLERTLLVGFSQGACLALEAAARRGGPLGGVAALAGGLLGTETLPGVDAPEDKLFGYETDLAGTPVFIGCGDRDPHIPITRVRQSAACFRRLGAQVTERVYPGVGHQITDDEVAWVRGALARLQEAA